jgi:glycosyltransferase involved in cell wall biosynthesis
MQFSLILATLNRTQQVDDFLNSLLKQTHINFEVIMIDQNDDDRLIPLVKKYNKYFSLKHIRSEKGLSKARNIGLSYVSGDIVAFPDDDCTYPPELLANIERFFSSNDDVIMMGKSIDKESGVIVAGKSIFSIESLSCYKFLGSSTTMFLYYAKMNKEDIYFDEVLGLGARFHSGEEEELMIRLLQKGYKGVYNPELNWVYHPPSDLNFSDIQRVKNRSLGLGALIIKHFFSRCGLFYFVKYVLLHPFISIIKSLVILDKMMITYHINRFIGILKGMFQYIIMISKDLRKNS